MANVSKIKLPNNASYDVTDASALHSSDKGAINGVAPLNASGLIDSAYLPSYVDDVIEGYYYNNKFWKESTHTTEIVGEAGKIYINIGTNPATTYRYSGSAFVQIGSGGSVVTITRNLTSGVKSATINIDGTSYDLYSTDNTTYESKAAVSGGTAVSLVTTGEKATWNAKSSFSGSYNDLTDKPTIPDVSGKIDTAGTGLSKSGTTLNHSNSVTAQTTQAVYPIQIDAQGHISGYGNAVTSMPASDVSAWAKAASKPSYTASEVGAQPTLVSGSNIKTINNESLLGSGNITIQGGGAGTITNIKTTEGSHTPVDISDGAVEFNVPTKTSHLTNDSGFITSHQDISGKIDTAGTGLSKSGTTLNHSNSTTARTTQAVYPIKIDAQGHISASGSAVTVPNIQYSTTDLTAGSSSLTTGHVYLVYE